MSGFQFFLFRCGVFALCGVVVCGVWYMLYLQGFLQPLSSRIRGLVIKHQRTGNPLVDSVAEHQPSNKQAYYQYLHVSMYLAMAGFGLCFFNRTNGKYFAILYAIVAQFFSLKMSR